MRIVRLRFLTIRLRTLRATLGVLLALHLGLAPAGVAHAAMMRMSIAAAFGGAQSDAVAPPCHEVTAVAAAVTSGAPLPAPGKLRSPCCDISRCHCVSACYVATTAVAPFSIVERHMLTPPFATPAAPSKLPAKQFRPPIDL